MTALGPLFLVRRGDVVTDQNGDWQFVISPVLLCTTYAEALALLAATGEPWRANLPSAG